ncbi:hypothetical protein CA265_17565 [Sphingobacteriaceae bacterium GW460-11-11-14-LB5]|nr:hypothetical protein CA265_17565 [Sphingobacteriaceae bacterium GW460-11-11-14-LB5]
MSIKYLNLTIIRKNKLLIRMLQFLTYFNNLKTLKDKSRKTKEASKSLALSALVFTVIVHLKAEW